MTRYLVYISLKDIIKNAFLVTRFVDQNFVAKLSYQISYHYFFKKTKRKENHIHQFYREHKRQAEDFLEKFEH